MLREGATEASLRLHPASLGTVTIQLRVEGDQVHAQLWAANATALPLLREGLPQLSQALQDQGLQLGSFDLHQGQRSFQGPPPSPMAPEPTGRPAPTARQEAPSPSPPIHRDPRRLELFA
jgi:flagellar hook-length control protein FliK